MQYDSSSSLAVDDFVKVRTGRSSMKATGDSTRIDNDGVDLQISTGD
jgi:sRNA-binding protein